MAWCATRLARRRATSRVLAGLFIGLWFALYREEESQLNSTKVRSEPVVHHRPRDFRARAHVQEDGSSHPLHSLVDDSSSTSSPEPAPVTPSASLSGKPAASSSGSASLPPSASVASTGSATPSKPPVSPSGSTTPSAASTPAPTVNPCHGARNPLPEGCLKVVVLSIYGNKTRYTSMVTVYARSIAALAPDWKLWVYFDPARPTPQAVLDELVRWGATLIPARTDLTRNGMMWRFLAADDPRVARFAARDADARFTLREAWSLREWEESGVPFHAQRDHGAHFDMSFPLGGMWGAVGGALPHMESTLRTGHNAQAEARGDIGWGADMAFLRSEVAPLMLSRGVLEHVPSVACAPKSAHLASPLRRALPFPRLGYEFLGSEGVRVDHVLGMERFPQALTCPRDNATVWNRTASRPLALLPVTPWEGSGGGVGAAQAVDDAAALVARVGEAVSLSATGRRAFAPLGTLDVLGASVRHAGSGVIATVIGSAAVTVTGNGSIKGGTHRLGRGPHARRAAVHHFRGLMPLTGRHASPNATIAAGAGQEEAAGVLFLHEQFPLGYIKRTAYEDPNFIVTPAMAVVLLQQHPQEGEGELGAGGPPAPGVTEAIGSVLRGPSLQGACLLVLVEDPAHPERGVHMCGAGAGDPGGQPAASLCAAFEGALPPCLQAESAARAVPANGPPDLRQDMTWWARDIVVLTAPPAPR